MRRKLLQRRWLLGILTLGSILWTSSQASSQAPAAAAVPPPPPKPGPGKATLPTRPPIFLNNNASLYTFPNPNFGKPSQHPFAFVAVAHEDCRLYNNGAKLMPQHRLLAAECMPNNPNMGGGGGITPILPPIYPPYPPPYPPYYPPPQGGFPGGGRGGMNLNRYPAMAGAIPAINPSSTATAPAPLAAPSSSSSSLATTPAATAKVYRGFGLASESSPTFAGALTNEGKSDFGSGFDRKKEE